ncbi:MAG: endonuclease/exonuclease/phosphatase family protein [Candidatus Levybacteria bacterium]|nr:endonuclease/exonuclease/phosphatase family protein [Candidatus Levybacteria bacterium]
MKLINLNIWGGKIHDPLIDFINKNKQNTDIFCFQENFSSDRLKILSLGMYSDIHETICQLLEEFSVFYYPLIEEEDARKKVNFPLTQGQVTFVRKNLKVLKSGEVYVYRKRNEMGPRYSDGSPDFPKNFIYTQIRANGKSFLIINIHGFWNHAAKTDTPERIKQSQMILDFIAKEGFPAIVAGDFNLRIETQSVEMFEENRFINLVKQFRVPTTRSNLYEIKWRAIDPFADYIFTSKDIVVKDFKVLPDVVSDHLPLYLEFEV